MPDERTPLLQLPGQNGHWPSENLGDPYHQFCHLVGVKPIDRPPDQKYTANPDSLYTRAIVHRRHQGATYIFTATLTNSLLLSQVVLGAALTALGASNSSRALITTFGALNTVIAGLIAFLKSRGQPMRARMFRDDLERVVDEIDNSATMWFGISKNAHGYDAIDTDDQVTVRSEVARLTRLYDRAVKTNTMNDPDMYAGGAPGDPHNAALRSRPGQVGQATLPPVPVAAGQGSAAPAPVPGPATDPTGHSPATSPPEPPKTKEDDAPNVDKKGDNAKEPAGDTSSPDQIQSVKTKTVAPDPDQSPATAVKPPKREKDESSKPSPEKEMVKPASVKENGRLN